jgi:hypothetical protein
MILSLQMTAADVRRSLEQPDALRANVQWLGANDIKSIYLAIAEWNADRTLWQAAPEEIHAILMPLRPQQLRCMEELIRCI